MVINLVIVVFGIDIVVVVDADVVTGFIDIAVVVATAMS